MSTLEQDEARKQARKEAHRLSMMAAGVAWAVGGVVAAYLAATSGHMPAFLFGHWRGAAEQAEQRPLRRVPPPMLVAWSPWSKDVLATAKGENAPVLVSVWAFWSEPSRLMDEAAYADPAAAKLISTRFVASRIDADERPDAARRYRASTLPTAAVLLPSGQVIDSGTLMPADILASWLKTLADGYAARRERLEQSAADALAERLSPAGSVPADPGGELARAKSDLQGSVDSDGAFSAEDGQRLPRFDRIALLSALPGQEWSRAMAVSAAGGALHLEDPAWGGFFRLASGSDWTPVEPERRLEDQAEAVAALSDLQPEAAARTVGFVEKFLSDPRGGYFAAQSPDIPLKDGRVYDGHAYFAQTDAARRALGLPAVDQRLFAAENARMAEAVLAAPVSVANAAAKKQAARSLERLWSQGISNGLVRRRFDQKGGVSGLLADQVAVISAFTAASDAHLGNTWLTRAKAVAEATERTLADEKTGALFDRPVMDEAPAALDRIAFPDEDFDAWRAYARLAKALPAKDPWRARLQTRAAVLAGWLRLNAGELDAAARATLAVEAP